MQINVLDQVQRLFSDVAKSHVTTNVAKSYAKPIATVMAFAIFGVHTLLGFIIEFLQSLDIEKIEQVLTRHPILWFVLALVWLWFITIKALNYTS